MTQKLICIQVVLQIIYSDTKVSETLPRVGGVLPPEKSSLFDFAVFKREDTKSKKRTLFSSFIHSHSYSFMRAEFFSDYLKELTI